MIRDSQTAMIRSTTQDLFGEDSARSLTHSLTDAPSGRQRELVVPMVTWVTINKTCFRPITKEEIAAIKNPRTAKPSFSARLETWKERWDGEDKS